MDHESRHLPEGVAPRAARARGAFSLARLAGAAAGKAPSPLPASGFLVLDEASGSGTIALEALRHAGHDVLLALVAAGTELHVNGLRTGRLAVLRPGDELRLNSRPPYRVGFQRASPFLRAGAEHAHAFCPLCRDPIVAGQRVYRCECEALTHADDADEEPESTRRECAFGTCNGCGRPIATELDTESDTVPGGSDAHE